MGPSRAKGRIKRIGVQQNNQRQQGMRPLFQQVEVVLQIISPSTSTPSKRWSVSVFCLMEQTPRNVITQLYYASTSKLAVTNNHIVVMGNSFLPSMWYWVVERSATTDSSLKPTWFANTNLDWGEDKQKQFVENQLGYKDSSSSSNNFHSKSFTQPAYFISGIDSVNDQIIFSGFKAGSVGYDSSSSSSSTKDQALAWSTTTSLDSKTGYKDLVTNETGLNGPINGSFSIQDTFSFVVPYSGNHSNQTSSGTIKTAYPVKNTEKSTVKINSLINATPLNSYGDLNIK